MTVIEEAPPAPTALLAKLTKRIIMSATPMIIHVRSATLILDAQGGYWADLIPVLDPEQDPHTGPFDATLVVGGGRAIAVIAPARAHLITRGERPARGTGASLARMEAVDYYQPNPQYRDYLEQLWAKTPGDNHDTAASSSARCGLQPEVLQPPTVHQLLSDGRVARFYVEASNVTVDEEGRGWLDDQLVPVAVPQAMQLDEERQVYVEIAEYAPYLRVRVPATDAWLVRTGEASRSSIGINRLVVEGEPGAPDVVSEPGEPTAQKQAGIPADGADPDAPRSWFAKLVGWFR